MWERVIISKDLRLWPWVAASLAIHAAVMLWPEGAEQPGSNSHEAVVEIALMSAKQTRNEPANQSSATADKREVAEAALHQSSVEYEEMIVTPEQTESLLESANEAVRALDVDGRESLVRSHLERFKYYPASARRRGITGEVEVAFELDSSGLAKVLKIMSGSGYGLLDDAAIQTVHRAEPFPAEGGAYQFVLRFRAS